MIENDLPSLSVAVIGEISVGKTCLVKRFVDNEYNIETTSPTIFSDSKCRKLVYNDQTYNVNISDTAGDEKYRSLMPIYLHVKDYVLVIFDLTSKSSFDAIDEYWALFLKDNAPENCAIILVGSKSDMPRDPENTDERIEQVRLTLGAESYFSTSAKDGIGINELFEFIVKSFRNKKPLQTGAIPEHKPEHKPKPMPEPRPRSGPELEDCC